MPALINDELSDRISFYYGEVADIDSLAWGDPLLRKRRLGGKRSDKLSLG